MNTLKNVSNLSSLLNRPKVPGTNLKSQSQTFPYDLVCRIQLFSLIAHGDTIMGFNWFWNLFYDF